MAAPHNVELEAAKFLHKLIQESKDEPTKLATKLYVILQHMRSSGKEKSMPYQVISRAMETVINQHGLDIEALKSSRLPLTGAIQGDSSSAHFAGSSQTGVILKDSKVGMSENEVANFHASSRPPVGPASAGHDMYQGSVSHLSAKSLDHESPSSFDTRSANSQSQERHDIANWEKSNQNDSKKGSSKRKRADSSSTTEPHLDNPQPLDANLNARKGKSVNKVEPPGSLAVKGSDHSQFNMGQVSGQMEQVPSLPGSMRPTNIANLMSRGPNPRYSEEIEVSSAHSASGLQQGSSRLSGHDILGSSGLWNQNRMGFPLDKSQLPRFPSSAGSGNSTTAMMIHQSTAPLGPNAPGKLHGAAAGASGSNQLAEIGISSPMHVNAAVFDNHGLLAKVNKERSREAYSASPSVELSAGKAAVDSEFMKHGFMRGALTSASERTGEAHFFAANRGELGSPSLSTGKALEHDGGSLNMFANANKMVQSGVPGNTTEVKMFRGAVPRDSGKSPMPQASSVSNMPFKEQHLKQLRAQCLVFLAFRNGLMPKKLHLEIALGNFLPKEEGIRKELIDHKGKDLSINDPSNISEDTMLHGRVNNVRETEMVPQSSSSTAILPLSNLSKESEELRMMGEKGQLPSDLSVHAEERRHPSSTRRKGEAEELTTEIAEPQAILIRGLQPDSTRGSAVSNRKDDSENGHQPGIGNQASCFMGAGKQIRSETTSWAGIGSHHEITTGSVPGSVASHIAILERKDIALNQPQILSDSNVQGTRHADGALPSFSTRECWKPILGVESEQQTGMPAKDTNMLTKHVSEGFLDELKVPGIQKRHIPDGYKTTFDDMQKNGIPTALETDEEEEDMSFGADLPPPKYTTSEMWIMEQQKRKLLIEQSWALKQQKTEQRIAACSEKLKESVSSSEDISAKTKSVIELKKLQLLELQRRLRGAILNDFFRPIAPEIDRLKSFKKHRIGRRSKQIERFEQKMKEERQKRIRERQKEFFSEIEVHKERLDDVFKLKRERWKGFNKYVREYHKRKERIHREKIDRIQREKINLLKINDVEGYLRMVQDAKSDRVKQLLKETEKYLQKLGSKLQEAKVMAKHFETDVDENRSANVAENNEFIVENEDDADQAKHYIESNEKYYLMAHSIKESIMEQPTILEGGKLREYQMSGLRWLVSLYNNHLNGILADEMGLGKTVQVISLICYLMESKNDRGPFLVVVPSSVLPGWESEINFWAPSVNKIVYSGPPEERRRLFKERIVHRKFNVLLTTYEYLMNKHDRPKLSKVDWHYIIIDEGHRIKNASCKLNADLKHYRSSHRLLLTGTPLQNNLEELWALLNFLLPNIFNSSEDFSQWFNKPFESNGDNSPDEALLSEEENLLIINRLHQVLRPFVLRRLKHKVENQLPEKIERLIRCEASSYQKLLMKRVEDNLGAIGTSKARSVHNSVMELRNICNHPYLSQLHVEEVHDLIPQHYLPNIVRLCGKLEMLDRLLPKLKATDHRVLLFSTMTRLLDVMEDYLCWKQYRYLRLDGHTCGGDRGALIDQFNKPGSPFFIFLLSIRAGGVGVNLQAADTVIIFDTDWNPQVDLQAQARAHRIGQKKDVLVIRLETVQTVEEQVRAAAEHKLGVANQSITAGFFDNNTSAEDRREYLESLLRECKKEEAAPVLDDDALNDLIARSESEIDIFESVDKQRREEEMAMWKTLVLGQGKSGTEPIPPLPSRLLTEDDLRAFYEAMKISEVSNTKVVSNVGTKRKSGYLGGLDTQHYGRGKRAREVRSYEEQWTEEEFEKMCQVDSPGSPKLEEEVIEKKLPIGVGGSNVVAVKIEPPAPSIVSLQPSVQPQIEQSKDVTPPLKRGRGRPKRVKVEISSSPVVCPSPSAPCKTEMASQGGTVSSIPTVPGSATVQAATGTAPQFGVWIAPMSDVTPPPPSVSTGAQLVPSPSPSAAIQGQSQKNQCVAEAPRRRGKGKKHASVPSTVQVPPAVLVPPSVPALLVPPTIPVPPTPCGAGKTDAISQGEGNSSLTTPACPDSLSGSSTLKGASNEQGLVSSAVSVLPAACESQEVDPGSEVQPVCSNPMVPGSNSSHASSTLTGISKTVHHAGVGVVPSSLPSSHFTSDALHSQAVPPNPSVTNQPKTRGRKPKSGAETPRRRGRKPGPEAPLAADGLAAQNPQSDEQPQSKGQSPAGRRPIGTRGRRDNEATELANVVEMQSVVQSTNVSAASHVKPSAQADIKEQQKDLLTSDSQFNNQKASDNAVNDKTDAKIPEKEHVLKEAVVSESILDVRENLEGSTLETDSTVDPAMPESKDVSVEAQERNNAVPQDVAVSKPEGCYFDSKIDADSCSCIEGSRDRIDNYSIMKTNFEGISAVDDVPCKKPPIPDALSVEEAVPVMTISVDKFADPGGKEDAKGKEMKGTDLENAVVSDRQETKMLKEKTLSTLEKALPGFVPEDQHTEDYAEQESGVLGPKVCESEIKVIASSKNMANQRDLVDEKLIEEIKVDDSSAMPINVGPLDDVPCEKPIVCASVSEAAPSVVDLVIKKREDLSAMDPGTEQSEASSASSGMDIGTENCDNCTTYSAMDLTTEKCEDLSGKEDAAEQEKICPVLDDNVVSEPGETKSLEEQEFSTLSTMVTAAKIDGCQDETTARVVNSEAKEISDSALQEAVVSEPKASGPETKINAGSFENVEAPVDSAKQKPAVSADLEGLEVPLGNLSCEKPNVSPSYSMDITTDKVDDCEQENAMEQQMRPPVPDNVRVPEFMETDSLEELPTLLTSEMPAPVVDPETEKIEREVNPEVQESRDPILMGVVTSEPEICEAENEVEAMSVVVSVPVQTENLEGRENEMEAASVVVSVPMETKNLEEMELPALMLETAAPKVEEIEKAGGAEEQGTNDSISQVAVCLKSEACEPEIIPEIVKSKGLEKEFSAPVIHSEISEAEKEVKIEVQESNNPILQATVSPEPEVCEPNIEIEAVSVVALEPVETVLVSEPMETKSLEEKEVSNLSLLEATVADNETEKIETEVGTEPQETEEIKKDAFSGTQEKNDPILQEAVLSEPSTCETATEVEAKLVETVADEKEVVKEILMVKGTPAVPQENAPTADVLVPETGDLTMDCTMYEQLEEQDKKEERQDVSGEGLDSKSMVRENEIPEKMPSTMETGSSIVDPSLETPAIQINAGLSEKAGDSKHLVKETQGLESENVEVAPAICTDPITKDHLACEEPPNFDASLNSSVGDGSSSVVSSSSASEGAKDTLLTEKKSPKGQ